MNRLVAALKEKMLKSFFMLSLLLCLIACAAEQAGPETVVREYVQLVSEGDIESAKIYCTPAGAAYLDALYEVMVASDTSLDTLPVDIQQLKCTLTDSTAFCQTLENDGFETYEASYHLKRTGEGWKIDQPPAEGETSTSEEIIDSEEGKENE
jgi:hypothetical protein